MRTNKKIEPVDEANIPSASQAVSEYRLSGGRITDPDSNCCDPLHNDVSKQTIREQAFSQQFPSMETIFHSVVNNNDEVFRQAIKFYIDITFRLLNSWLTPT